MATAALMATAAGTAAGARSPVMALVLARLAAEPGATRPELARDLAPLMGSKPAAAEQRAALDNALADLLGNGLAVETGNRIALTLAGDGAARAALGGRPLPKSWDEARDQRLVALALGLEREPASRLKRLSRPDGLRAAIVQRAFGLASKDAASPSRLRSALAVVALERAFGNRIKGGLGSGKGLSAKAARLLAGQLSSKPREFGTDSRLLAALAAEGSGAGDASPEAMRLALLRRYTEPGLRIELRPTAVVVAAAPAPAPQPRPAAASRPDLAGFVRTVQTAAAIRAQGWPGNRKAFISHVWQEVGAAHPEWGLTAIEFKAMLAEAHRTGHLVLANADLKDKRYLKEFQESAIAYKNTVWHFVRVED
jgi:hypothetical protein